MFYFRARAGGNPPSIFVPNAECANPAVLKLGLLQRQQRARNCSSCTCIWRRGRKFGNRWRRRSPEVSSWSSGRSGEPVSLPYGVRGRERLEGGRGVEGRAVLSALGPRAVRHNGVTARRAWVDRQIGATALRDRTANGVVERVAPEAAVQR